MAPGRGAGLPEGNASGKAGSFAETGRAAAGIGTPSEPLPRSKSPPKNRYLTKTTNQTSQTSTQNGVRPRRTPSPIKKKASSISTQSSHRHGEPSSKSMPSMSMIMIIVPSATFTRQYADVDVETPKGLLDKKSRFSSTKSRFGLEEVSVHFGQSLGSFSLPQRLRQFPASFRFSHYAPILI